MGSNPAEVGGFFDDVKWSSRKGYQYFKMSCFCTDDKISVRINLPLFSTVILTVVVHKTC